MISGLDTLNPDEHGVVNPDEHFMTSVFMQAKALLDNLGMPYNVGHVLELSYFLWDDFRADDSLDDVCIDCRTKKL